MLSSYPAACFRDWARAWLSVTAFPPPLLLQFVGRTVRRIMKDKASGRDMSGCDEDNTAYVIAPPLLGYQRHWDIYTVRTAVWKLGGELLCVDCGVEPAAVRGRLLHLAQCTGCAWLQ